MLIVDATDPTVTINRPYEGARYSKDADPKPDLTSDYDCTDADSGIASCVGTVADGDPFDRSSIGTKTFTVTATDNAGNTATKSVTYRVFDFPGLIGDDHPVAYYRLGDPSGSKTMAASAGPGGYYQNEQESEPFGISGDGDAARYFFDADQNGVGDGHGYANSINAPRSYTLSAFFRIQDGGRTQMILEHGGAGSIWYHSEAGHNHLHFRPVVWDGVRLSSPPGSVQSGRWYHVAATYKYIVDPQNDQLGGPALRSST